MKLFSKIKEELGELDIIAEDLGFLTPAVREMLAACGFPGMKIFQFGFNPKAESEYAPTLIQRTPSFIPAPMTARL